MSQCHYCGLPYQSGRKATDDHIVPIAITRKLGLRINCNRVSACMTCNTAKADMISDCPCSKCVNAVAQLNGIPFQSISVERIVVLSRRLQKKYEKRQARNNDLAEHDFMELVNRYDRPLWS